MAISPKLQRLVERQGGRCHLCGGLVVPDDEEHPGFPSRDHVTPRRYTTNGEVHSRDGAIKLAHRICNSYRGCRKAHRCGYEEFGIRYRKAVAEYEARKLLVDGMYSTG